MAIKSLLLLLVTFAIGIPTAFAAPIQWVLQDVIFDDGGTASGTYIYDADTSSLSDISIITTSGTNPSFPGETFIFPAAPGQPPNHISVGTALPQGSWAGIYRLILDLDGDMDNTGGTLQIQPLSQEMLCELDSCGATKIRYITSGSVSAVPIPAAIWLFGSGLIGLVGFARSKKA